MARTSVTILREIQMAKNSPVSAEMKAAIVAELESELEVMMAAKLKQAKLDLAPKSGVDKPGK